MNAERLAVALLLLGLAATTTAAPAQVTELTLENIYRTDAFSPRQVDLEWTDDGRAYTVIETDAAGRTDLYRVDAVSGRREVIVHGTDLMPADGDTPVRIGSYEFSPNGSKLLIASDEVGIWRRSRKARYYVWDLETKKLTALSDRTGYQQYAKFAPDGGRVAFVRENDIFVADLSSGSERALTTDGDEDIINGGADWVYEEELGLTDAFRWSPDGARIAFLRFDQSPIPPFYLIDQMTLYPELQPVRYPKAGTDNSRVTLGVVELESGEITWIDPGVENEEFYIARMDFAGSPDEVWFQRLNRHQNRMDLLLANVETGGSRTIMTDTDERWLYINEPIWIEEGRRFVYSSERDGWDQLYLYERDGSLVRKLTTGEWDVIEVFGVDDGADVVYFTGAADGPLVRPIYRVGLDGKGFARLSGSEGWHSADFAPGFRLYVDEYSQAGVPPRQTLRRPPFDSVRVLAESTDLQQRLEALELSRPEFITVPSADPGVELNAWIIKPPDFDPSRRYPLLMYVYGGPGSQTVTDSWGGDRYLWHQIMAREGWLVASVDNRGTGARGSAFKKITYLNLGKHESADQIAAARHFAALPYVDGERIAIWGWSYGGYMSSLTAFKGNDVFAAAISVAPVTDWRLYDTIYTERYMRTPQENPGGYAESAPLVYADRLRGRFLLMHGTGDDNVHAQNSLQLVERLEGANKQFAFRLYPNMAHGISAPEARINLYSYMTEWLTGRQ